MREAARKKEDYEKLPTAVQKQESPEWSQTLSLAEVQGIQAALEAVGDEREQLEAEGLSRVSWSIGVVNVVLTTLVFGKAPEYMWVMYAVKCYIYIPGWWYKVHRLYNGGLYILDFCWVMSICFGVYMSALLMATRLGLHSTAQWHHLSLHREDSEPLHSYYACTCDLYDFHMS
eukprot:gnl/TRDRNA2_/TRDRNA2_80778_c0_seq2.p1 gnl/TRDRNA2_/TRDRNA2_80778_c0~~gnl/TRDRNA2_/TRDRNA2_80778_c0_seq2.p1  ORF type:complete len:174 (-),score=33.52 gnl/TRDRNA2_/TRDRNA2_80778_c0_seq2:660-1181(-)